MKKLKISKIMLIVGIIAVICCISNISNAEPGNSNDIIHEITNLPSDGNNMVQDPVDTNKPINNIDNTNNVTTTNTTLPKTGVDDTIMWVLIGVCGLAAVYTYKKVRDYNV